MTVYEDVLQISCQAGSEITKALQEVIVTNSLAEMNGINSVTDNLAPGYQRCSVKVDYISGEKLQFDINNDPHARWAEDVYAVFAEWFTQNGNSVLYPKGETSQIESFVLKFKDEEHNFRYRTYTENSKESAPVCIEKTVYDISTYKIVSNDTVALTADYFRTIAEIADSYNLGRKYDFSHYDHQAKNYGNHAKGYYGMGTGGETDEKDLENLAFSLYIKYESGKTINIETSKASEIEGMMPLIADFVEYHISLF